MKADSALIMSFFKNEVPAGSVRINLNGQTNTKSPTSSWVNWAKWLAAKRRLIKPDG